MDDELPTASKVNFLILPKEKTSFWRDLAIFTSGLHGDLGLLVIQTTRRRETWYINGASVRSRDRETQSSNCAVAILKLLVTCHLLAGDLGLDANKQNQDAKAIMMS